MIELFERLSDYLHEHWIKFVTVAVFMGLSWLMGRWRAQKNWEQKEFFDRLNVSLTIIKDGKLLIRTLVEKNCQDVFLNSVAAKAITTAARKTSESDPSKITGNHEFGANAATAAEQGIQTALEQFGKPKGRENAPGQSKKADPIVPFSTNTERAEQRPRSDIAAGEFLDLVA